MGANKTSFWDKVIERIKLKLFSWKAHWLSLSGRILLVKTILTTIPNYFISVLKVPTKIVDQIEKLIRSFIWKSNMDDVKKIPLLSFKNMAMEEEKGVVLHDISKCNLAIGGKLV